MKCGRVGGFLRCTEFLRSCESYLVRTKCGCARKQREKDKEHGSKAAGLTSATNKTVKTEQPKSTSRTQRIWRSTCKLPIVMKEPIHEQLQSLRVEFAHLVPISKLITILKKGKAIKITFSVNSGHSWALLCGKLRLPGIGLFEQIWHEVTRCCTYPQTRQTSESLNADDVFWRSGTC